MTFCQIISKLPSLFSQIISKSLVTLLLRIAKGTDILDLGMSYWDIVHTVHPLSPRVNITTAVDQL
jgi:hypothetical protein